MGERTVTVTEEAYDALRQATGNEQTLSEAILSALGCAERVSAGRNWTTRKERCTT